MTAYRTRPRTVDAVQWDDTNESAVKAIAGTGFYAVDPEDRTEVPEETGALLDTRHNEWLPVCCGDWVVRDADGRLTVWDSDDFTTAYEQDEIPARPMLAVTEYTANALPPEARIADWWHWNVYARRTRAGRWIVTDGHAFYDADGNPHFSAREAGDHERGIAIDLATQVASTMRINGETAAEAAARILRAVDGGA